MSLTDWSLFLHNFNFMTTLIWIFSFPSYETWIQLHASFHLHHAVCCPNHTVAQDCQEGNWLAPKVTITSLHDKPHFIVFLGWKQKLCVQNGRHMQYKNMIFYRNIKKNMYWPILKKIVQLLYSILYMEKNINIYVHICSSHSSTYSKMLWCILHIKCW